MEFVLRKTAIMRMRGDGSSAMFKRKIYDTLLSWKKGQLHHGSMGDATRPHAVGLLEKMIAESCKCSQMLQRHAFALDVIDPYYRRAQNSEEIHNPKISLKVALYTHSN